MSLSAFSLLLLGLTLGLTLGLASASGLAEVKLERGGCPMFWYGFNGRCYRYVASRMSWADAELHCVSLSANLVSIHSAAEHDFVKLLVDNYGPHQRTWMGLSDLHKEGAWMWSDGGAVDFTLWNAGIPDNWNGREHCVEIHVQWNDNECSVQSPFVCASR